MGATQQLLYGYSGFVGPLDAYTANLAAPWSVARRLLSSYTGSLITVRRSSDNSETSIGYLASGNLDTVSLLSFAGSGDAFVKTVKNQTGGADFTQTTAAAQPTIVSGGSLITLNSKPAMLFGVDKYLESTQSGGGAAAWTNYMVGSTGALTLGYQYTRFLSASSTGVNDYQTVNGFIGMNRDNRTTTYTAYINNVVVTDGTMTDGTAFIASSRFQSSNPVRYLKINGGSAATNNTAATPNLTFNKMRWGRGISSFDYLEYWDGKGAEILCYNAANSDPTTIMGVLNSYYATY